MGIVYKKPDSLKDTVNHFCPGCSHGIVNKLVAEVIDELNMEGSTIGISSVGCSYPNYEYFNFDFIQSSHGRAPAVATGVKRVHPNNLVYTYQGDGDLAAIGMGEIIHVASRSEKISTLFVNNAVYGMTSGQMAPTTLIDQVTQTTPFGRKADKQGFPINICELIATIEGAVYVERVSIHDIRNIRKTKAAIKKSFKIQLLNLGFSIVEILSTCPTNWGMSPIESMKWVETNMIPQYPLGVFKGSELEV